MLPPDLRSDGELSSLAMQGDKDQVRADEKLEDMFGRNSFAVGELPKLMEAHILPKAPCCLPFTIR